MKKKSLLMLTIICFVSVCLLVGCSIRIPTNRVDNVTNNVTVDSTINQVTVDYGSLSITDLEQAVQTCIKKVSPSVIGITLKNVVNTKVGTTMVRYEDPASYGSAVVYERVENKDDKDQLKDYTYYAYTNSHVVTAESGEESVCYAYLGDFDTECKLEILGKDDKLDIACVKFTSYYYLPTCELANSDEIEKGTFVIAVGNPDGYDYYNSATFGIVSNLGRYLSFDTDDDGTNDFVGEYIQTDAAINPGNSGGGLFTLEGKLIGINSIKIAATNIDNMGFAIPSNIVKIAVNEYLSKGEEILRPRLGINCIAVRDMTSQVMSKYGITSFPNIYNDEKPYGIYIVNFSKNGSLVNQGLADGDIILTFDGYKLYSNTDISGRLNAIDKYKIGNEVEITYYSYKTNKIETVNITLTVGD